jgi:hypothetical protein
MARMTGTWSSSISFWVADSAPAGVDSVSAVTNASFCPLTPPALLIALKVICRPCTAVV